MNQEELNKSLETTKVLMMVSDDSEFISSVMLNLDISFSSECKTADTDGLSMRISPVFWEPLSKKQRLFLLAHEVWHTCFDHINRTKESNYEHKRANIAADMEINNMLIKAKYEFIKGGVADPKYNDMYFEQIYELIDPDDFPDFEPDMLEQAEGSSNKEEIDEILLQAAIATDMADSWGNVPESIKRYIEEIRNPKLPWYQLLQQYFTEKIKDDYSWSKRNRRYHDVYLPSLYSEGMGHLAVYEDLSGSITQKEHSLQVAEMKYIQQLMNPSLMTFNGFTTVLGKTEYYEQGQEIEPNWNMTGGTSIEPVLRNICETEPEVAVIFTDGWFHMPQDLLSSVRSDIIWVIVNNQEWKCAKGKILHMEIQNN